ncbi:hypothetical protein D3C78_1110670 [compost metagenome]
MLNLSLFSLSIIITRERKALKQQHTGEAGLLEIRSLCSVGLGLEAYSIITLNMYI